MAWSNKPPKETGPQSRTLWRAEPKKTRGGIILCHETLGVGTHYHQGRTILCEDDSCELCLLYGPARWSGFWSVFHGPSKPLTLFQFTSGCWPTVESYLQKWSDLRGAKFTAERATARHNSRVLLTLDRADGNPGDLPQSFNIEATLRKIWRLPTVDQKPKDKDESSKILAERILNQRANGHTLAANPTLDRMEPNG